MGDNRELYIRVNCSHQVDDNKTYCAVIVQGALITCTDFKTSALLNACECVIGITGNMEKKNTTKNGAGINGGQTVDKRWTTHG